TNAPPSSPHWPPQRSQRRFSWKAKARWPSSGCRHLLPVFGEKCPAGDEGRRKRRRALWLTWARHANQPSGKDRIPRPPEMWRNLDAPALLFPCHNRGNTPMHGIIYLVGLVVIVLAV